MSIITKNENVDIGDEIEVTLHINELLSHEKVYNSQFNNQSDWKRVFVYYKNESKTENETLIFKNVDSSSSSVAYFNPIDTTEDFLVNMVIILTKQGTYLVIRRSDLVVENFDVNSNNSDGSRSESSTGGSDSFSLTKTLISPNENVNDKFGDSIIFDENYIVVSADFDDGSNDNIANAGEVYVFKKDEGGFDNWGINKILNSPNQSISDYFGQSISKYENYIVVGSSHDGGVSDTLTRAGEVYVFKRYNDPTGNWGLIKIINLPDEINYKYFGHKVAIFGDYIVVLSTRSPDQIHIFKKDEGGFDNWGLLKTITLPSSFTSTIFFNHDCLFIGCESGICLYKKDEGGVDNWGLTNTISVVSNFSSFSVSGDYIVVGKNDDKGSNDQITLAGEAYVYKKDEGGVDNWGLIKTLNSPNESLYDFFGSSVSIDGDYIVVGSHADDGSTDEIINAGEAYVYKKDEGGVDNWGLIQTLNSPNENEHGFFGLAVVISGNYIVVGDGAERVYLFKK